MTTPAEEVRRETERELQILELKKQIGKVQANIQHLEELLEHYYDQLFKAKGE